MTSSVLNRASLSEQIREALLEQILSGVLKPGDRLVELKIAERMNTSQGPVREALRELETIGVIEVERNKGARVRVISDQELTDIYHVRAELEALAGELVATRSPATAKKLDAIMVNMLKAANAGNSQRFSEVNSKFHSTIMQACGNQTMLEIWNGLHVLSRTRVKLSRSSCDLVAIAHSHLQIADAIRSGNPVKAREASWLHVRENTLTRQK